jgi:hypothetical protein
VPLSVSDESWKPSAGVTVQTTIEPCTAAAGQRTVPEPVTSVVMGKVSLSKRAVMVVSAVGVKMQTGSVEPLQTVPLQLVNCDPALPVAVSAMETLGTNWPVQVVPQLICKGALTTTPAPLPAVSLATVRSTSAPES